MAAVVVLYRQNLADTKVKPTACLSVNKVFECGNIACQTTLQNMKINKKFNQLSYSRLKEIIVNHKKYTDFNTLGIYRAIVEHEKLSTEQKIEIRDLANEYFGKTFNFLQVKDPRTYFELIVLGEEELTVADEAKIWDEIKRNSEKILKDKRIKHRNFGYYSKHNCGDDACAFNGVMFKEGSRHLL